MLIKNLSSVELSLIFVWILFAVTSIFDKRTFLAKIPINYHDALVSLFDSAINMQSLILNMYT